MRIEAIALFSLLFIGSSGHSEPGWSRFSELLIETMPATGPRNADLAEITKVQIWMSVPLSAIPIMDTYGILNLFQTGSSQGSSSQSAIRIRLARERRTSPLLRNLFMFPTQLHPKCGFLYVESGTEMTEQWNGSTEAVGQQYESTYFVLKDKLFERTTYTLGDSLREGSRFSPMSDLTQLRKDIHRGGRGDYYESQTWGPLTLEDVSDLYLLKRHPFLGQRKDYIGIAKELGPIADKYGFSIWEIGTHPSYEFEGVQSNLPFKRKILYAPKGKVRGFRPLSDGHLITRYGVLNKEWESLQKKLGYHVDPGERDVAFSKFSIALEMRIVLDALASSKSQKALNFIAQLYQGHTDQDHFSKYLKGLLSARAEEKAFLEGISKDRGAPINLRALAEKRKNACSDILGGI